MSLYIKGDLSNIQRALQRTPKIARAAAISALNKTVAQAATKGTKELSAAVKIPVKLLKTRTIIVKARKDKLYSRIIFLSLGFPIDRLSTAIELVGKKNGRGRGIRAAGKRYPQAFKVKANKVIFERKLVGGKRSKRLPIERVKIPLQPEADQLYSNALTLLTRTKLDSIFQHELEYRLKKAGV